MRAVSSVEICRAPMLQFLHSICMTCTSDVFRGRHPCVLFQTFQSRIVTQLKHDSDQHVVTPLEPVVVSSGVMILVRGSILPFLLGSLSRGLIFVLEGDNQILSVAFPEKEGA